MTLHKPSVLTVLLFGLLACHQTSQKYENIEVNDNAKVGRVKTAATSSDASTTKADGSIKNKSTEEKIIDAVFGLREVKKRERYIEEQAKGKRRLKVWVADTPNLPAKKYYWIKVGEDNGASLVTHFNFHVYPDSMRILYYDSQSDSELTLSTWRKIRPSHRLTGE